MFIGKTGNQNTGLNISAINRSAAYKLEAAGSRKEQEKRTDVAAISPAGKNQSMIGQLMKQKEFLQDRKQSLLDSAAEKGTEGINEQLKEYEKQMKELDEQITRLQTEQADDIGSEDDNTGRIYEKPKTKEEDQMDQLNNIAELSANSSQAEVIASVQDRLDGRASVLKAEIKTGNGNIEKKTKEAAELESRSSQLTSQIAEKLHENTKDTAEADGSIKADSKLSDKNFKENVIPGNPETDVLPEQSEEQQVN